MVANWQMPEINPLPFPERLIRRKQKQTIMGIDPKSLRTGNILENGIVVTVQYSNGVFGCIITQSNYSSGHDWEFTSLADLKALPLSPSLLEMAGFTKLNEHYYEGYGIGFIVGYAESSEDANFVIQNSFGARHCHFYQLHELQNIVRDLTGQELELKP